MTTADFDEDYELNSDSQEETCWGRLLPLGKYFKLIELRGNKYSFGRSETCDYVFNDPELKKICNFFAYSNTHFVLTREIDENNEFTFLEDCSTHGTFINGIKVGKNKRRMLNNNDEIALLSQNNKVFLYVDQSGPEEGSYPPEIRNKYIISKVLGRGSFGEVRHVFERTTSASYAIKSISKTSGNMEPDKLMNEVNLMKRLHHPCIVKIEDVIDTESHLHIILELVRGGDLYDHIVNTGNLSESATKLIFYQILCGVQYLHDQGITHRDLKAENILLDGDEKNLLIKITDFGVSKFIDERTCLKTVICTPSYCAPEIIQVAFKKKASYTNAVDNWSLGIILYACLVGHLPFEDNGESESLAENILQGKYSFPQQYWKHISTDAIDLIKKFLTVDPTQRITLRQAMAHPWLQDKQIIQKAHDLMYQSVDHKHLLEDQQEDNGLMNNCKRRRIEISSSDATESPSS